MAVTISVSDLLEALRLGSTDAETNQATRLLAYATAAVQKHAPEADSTIQNEAVVRLAGYLFDQPFTGRGPAFSNALRNSGSAAILLPWRIHRAGSTAEAVAVAQADVGTPGNPVTNVTVTGSVLTITFADGETSDEELGVNGDSRVDQTARDAAASAQTTADEADVDQVARDAAASAQTTADEADVDQVARDAAASAQTTADEADVDQVARDAAAAAQATADAGVTPVTGSVASTGTAVATVSSRFRRVVVMAGGTINNTQSATEFTLTGNIAAGEKLSFIFTDIGRAYGEVFTDELLALSTSYSAAPTRSGDGLVIKIHQANTAAFGHDSLYVFKSDEANKIWLSLGRNESSSGRAQTLSISRHFIDVSVNVDVGVDSVLTLNGGSNAT